MVNKTPSMKPRYNLNLVIQETGLKADTLRAWERRYQLPQPARSDGGHRLYSDYDIQLLKWLQDRQEEGMRISQAVDYWHELVSSGENPLEQVQTQIIQTIDSASQSLDELHDRWIKACLEYDEEGADQILNQAFAQFPVEIVCVDLISSALQTIGDLWYRGEASVQQEHYASELAIRKLHTLIATAPRPIHNKMVLLLCPQGEQHTTPLLIMNLLLRFRGWEVLNLGANVPTDKLAETVLETQPDLAVLSATRLPTAASLLEAAQLLKTYQVPVGYSGWIFTQIPQLIEMIPAHYLSDGLDSSIPIIEDILANPTFKVIEEPLPAHPAFTAFSQNQSRINQSIMDSFAPHVDPGLLPEIQNANSFLGDVISAGLKFGDLSLVKFDLNWIYGLLTNRLLSTSMLQNYLGEYSQAVKAHLGDDGNNIVDWLITRSELVA